MGLEMGSEDQGLKSYLIQDQDVLLVLEISQERKGKKKFNRTHLVTDQCQIMPYLETP